MGERIPKKVVATPLPLRRMAIPLLIQLLESIAITQILPYAPFMVQNLLQASDDDIRIGTYVGILDAVYPFATALTGYAWGSLSDHIGRRPAILLGTLGTTTAWFAFGFSVNLPMAIVMRLLYGMSNGNVAIIKSFIGEILDGSNQAKGMSLFVCAYSVGLILGPFIGGTLYDPASKYPLFQGTLFEELPHLLPNLVCCCCSFISFVLGYAYLEETVENPISFKDYFKSKLGGAAPSSTQKMDIDVDECLVQNMGESVDSGEYEEKKKSVIRILLENRSYTGCVMLYMMQGAVYYAYLTVFPLWAKISPSREGFGLGTSEIGFIQSLGSPGFLIMQLWMFPMLAKCMTYLTIIRVTAILASTTMFIYPLLALTPIDMRIPVFCIHQMMYCALLSAVVTSSQCLLINSISHSMLGRGFGLMVALSGVTKSAGALLGGTLFSVMADGDLSGGYRDIPFFNRNGVQYILGLLYIALFVISYRISEDSNTPYVATTKSRSNSMDSTSSSQRLR